MEEMAEERMSEGKKDNENRWKEKIEKKKI